MQVKATTRKLIVPIGLAAVLCATQSQAASFKAGETDVGIYGFIEMDMMYDNHANLGNMAFDWNVRVDGEDGSDGGVGGAGGHVSRWDERRL